MGLRAIVVVTALAGFAGLLPAAPARASAFLFTDLASWQAAVREVETLATTAAGVALADEVAAPPVANQQLGHGLTFGTAATGLARGFRLTTPDVAPGLLDGFIFDDQDGPNEPSFDNALSVGDINDFENDDWALHLLDGALMTAFGFELRGSYAEKGETVTLLDASLAPLTTLVLPDLGLPGTAVNAFIGVVSTEAFAGIRYDEGAGGDDIAIANFRFARIPEPAALPLLAVGLAFLAGLRRRRRAIGHDHR